MVPAPDEGAGQDDRIDYGLLDRDWATKEYDSYEPIHDAPTLLHFPPQGANVA